MRTGLSWRGYLPPNVLGCYLLLSGAWACSAAEPTRPPEAPLPPASQVCASAARRVVVGSTAQLTAAISAAKPGDCIQATPGNYALGTEVWAHPGTEMQRITLEGSGPATVLTLGGNGGIRLRASYWTIRNLRVTSGFFGIQTEGVGYVDLDSLEIDNLRQAAVNLFYGTHHTTVRRSKIHDTGQGTARFGEGVYIGGNAAPDNSAPDSAADDNNVLDNQFGPNVTAEAVDISLGADRVTMTGNTLDGAGTVSESGFTSSLVAVRGIGHEIDDNRLSKGAPNGIDVYEGTATFRRNLIDLQSAGFGIRRVGGAIVLDCDNAVTNVQSGGAAYNVPCTP